MEVCKCVLVCVCVLLCDVYYYVKCACGCYPVIVVRLLQYIVMCVIRSVQHSVISDLSFPFHDKLEETRPNRCLESEIYKEWCVDGLQECIRRYVYILQRGTTVICACTSVRAAVS